MKVTASQETSANRPARRFDRATIAAAMVPALMLLYPVVLLSIKSGMSACQLVLVIFSGIYLFQREGRITWTTADVTFAAAMSSLAVFTVAAEALHQTFRLGALDGPSRFLFAIPIYLALRSMPLSSFAPLQYSFPLGVFAGLLTTMLFHGPHNVFFGTYFLDAPMWGSAMLALAFLSVTMINWTKKDVSIQYFLKFGSFVVGLYSAIKADERGIWIAIPVLGALWAYYRSSPKQRVALAGLGCVLALAAYLLIPTVPARIATTQIEIHKALNGDFESSIGKRLQIWNAAVEVFREHPIVGVGPEGVSRELRDLGDRGWFTSGGLRAGLSQIHNEILANSMRLGVFGLFSILAIYFVPFWLFMKAARSTQRVTNTAGLMGILFVAAYFIFGLTVETFNLKMFASFYAVTVATMLAIAHNSNLEIAGRTSK